MRIKSAKDLIAYTKAYSLAMQFFEYRTHLFVCRNWENACKYEKSSQFLFDMLSDFFIVFSDL